MDFLQQAASLIGERLGLNIDDSSLQTAVAALLGDGSSINLAELTGKLAGSGQFSDLLQSWLGDGENSPMDAGGILDLLGGDKLSEFASAVGTDSQAAAEGLADVLPRLIDGASSGGNLLDAVGGVGGLMGAASSLFKR